MKRDDRPQRAMPVEHQKHANSHDQHLEDQNRHRRQSLDQRVEQIEAHRRSRQLLRLAPKILDLPPLK